MEKSVSATDAKRRFSNILQGVRKGLSYVVTLYGRPVARLIPAEANDRSVALAALLARLKAQPTAKKVGMRRRWTRDELYERS